MASITKIALKFIYTYAGGVTVFKSTVEIGGSPSIFTIIILAVSSCVFAYGIVAINRDVKKAIKKWK